MQPNEKAKLFEAIQRLAIAKGADVTKERIQIYVEYICKKITLKEAYAALEKVFETIPRFPDISDILKAARPDDQEDAIEMAGAIIEAMTKFSEYDQKSAQEYLGELAWVAVERFGGWLALCRLKYDELGTARAQLRDICRANLKASRRVSSKNLLSWQREPSAKLKRMKLELIEGEGA